jgi:hypothetical protein
MNQNWPDFEVSYRITCFGLSGHRQTYKMADLSKSAALFSFYTLLDVSCTEMETI